MVRVLPAAMFASLDGRHASVEVVEGNGEVPSVATGGLEAEPGREEAPTRTRVRISDQGRLLRQLVDGGVAGCEHRDPVFVAQHSVSDIVCRYLVVMRELLRGAIRLHILHHADLDEVHGAWMAEELAHHGYRISPGTLYPGGVRR